MNKNRLEAFSDGVLAIIITIMVLEIKVPHGSDWLELQRLAPVFISYLMSFMFVGIYWANHHHLLHSVRRVTSGLIWSNLNLLFWLSLIPFATGWMGENHFASNTVATYGTLLLLCGISYTILQKNVEQNAQDLEALQIAFANQKIKGIASTAMYAASIPLAYYNPTISGMLFFIVSIIWFIPDKNIERALRE